MKSYFNNLFDYDKHASELMLQCILANNTSEKAVQLMAHVLAAQQIWLSRCENVQPSNFILWPAWPVSSLHQYIECNHQAWMSFLKQLDEQDFETEINYKNTKGEAFCSRLDNLLGHVINHGTHHRAQIGQLLKFNGAALPQTDYILFLRERNIR